MTNKRKIALVTGGSRGIGRSVCRALARDGMQVFVNYRAGEREAAETVALCGNAAQAIQFDVANSEEVSRALSSIKEQAGGVDVVVSNAGISKDGLAARIKDEDFNLTMQTNLYGSFYVAREAAKMMIRQRSGSIIFMSSVVGQMGNIGQASYVASKAGLIGLTKALARELGSRAVTVNAIAPGFIETEMTGSLDPKVQEEHKSSIPLTRYGTPDEVADLAAFLASDRARYITGQVIGINGGMYM